MDTNIGYIHYNSLNTIIQDIMNVIRGNNIAQSEQISRNQIEMWIHQYRSMLLKQDLDRGRYVNETYVQEVNGLEMEPFDYGDLSGRDLKLLVFRSKTKIPKTIDLHFKNGIVQLTTISGKEIQLMPESRAVRQRHRKWTKFDIVAYMKEDYLYIESLFPIKLVNLKAIFEVPTEVQNILTNTGYIEYDYNAPYECPSNIIAQLKEFIYSKELGLMTQAISDRTNNANDDLSEINRLFGKLKDLYDKRSRLDS